MGMRKYIRGLSCCFCF